MRRDRQAAAIHRNAVADLDFLCDTRRDDLKLRASIDRGDLDDSADFFNQTGKHKISCLRFLSAEPLIQHDPEPHPVKCSTVVRRLAAQKFILIFRSEQRRSPHARLRL